MPRERHLRPREETHCCRSPASSWDEIVCPVSPDNPGQDRQTDRQSCALLSLSPSGSSPSRKFFWTVTPHPPAVAGAQVCSAACRPTRQLSLALAGSSHPCLLLSHTSSPGIQWLRPCPCMAAHAILWFLCVSAAP